MTMRNKISVLIPAAGLGKRSNLGYPKSLYKVKRIHIIVRILKKVIKYDKNPTIVINKKYHFLFESTLNSFKFKNIKYLFQNKPTGMGDAVLQFKKSYKFNSTENILLVWGDIPYISRKSINKLIHEHVSKSNFMTILSLFAKSPYTLINKDDNDNVVEILESYKNNKNFQFGERDIGIFIFKKKLLKYLNIKSKNKEHNFLYVVNKLYKKNYKIKSLSIASNKEAISLNYIKDLN